MYQYFNGYIHLYECNNNATPLKLCNIQKDVFGNIIVLMVQRRRCCSFDSPGLVRYEPTLGKWLQGDSTL